MDVELRYQLSQLGDDLRAGRLDRAALFWLKIFADLASQDDGKVRSDRWVEAGLEAAEQIPGLTVTDLAPRRGWPERGG